MPDASDIAADAALKDRLADDARRRVRIAQATSMLASLLIEIHDLGAEAGSGMPAVITAIDGARLDLGRRRREALLLAGWIV